MFCKKNFFFHYIKSGKYSLLSKKQRKLLSRAKDYYENDKERLRKQARNKYRNLSEEDKKKKREYGKNRYHDMSEKKKQKLKNIKNKDIKKQKSQRIMNKVVF